MNQVFVRFVPTWEVDPEPVVVKEPGLEEKEALYDRLLAEAVDISANYWQVLTKTFFLFENSVFILNIPRAGGRYGSLLKIDRSFCKYFPSGEIDSFEEFQKDISTYWTRDRSRAKYLTYCSNSTFRIGEMYPNTDLRIESW